MNEAAQQPAERTVRNPAAAERAAGIAVPGPSAGATDLIHDGLAPATWRVITNPHEQVFRCFANRQYNDGLIEEVGSSSMPRRALNRWDSTQADGRARHHSTFGGRWTQAGCPR
jgi:hypothetical protein